MVKRIVCTGLIVLLGFSQLYSWGFFAHRSINRLAIYTLPPELMRYFKTHANYLSEHAVDADKRRYSTEDEAPRHYLDVDHYEKELPLDSLPRRWSDAIEKYSEDTLKAYGIGPWHLQFMLYQLTEAFREKDERKMLKLAADLGHYCGDLHVPLHSTLNYNGQLTGQKGIHGFWESRLPELFSESYDFVVGPAVYLDRPSEAIWAAFEASHAAKDSVLTFERELDSIFNGDKYSYEIRGKASVKVYSKAYSEAYHKALNGMIERRMREAIHLLGSLWMTAWINAGSPDLTAVVKQEMADSIVIHDVQKAFELERGKMLGREEPK